MTESWHKSDICNSCGKHRQRKPADDCVQGSHHDAYARRRKTNNSYRRKKRKENPYYASGYTREEWIEHSRLRMRKLKSSILAKLGKVCAMCGFDDFRALEIDHKSGFGNMERRQYGWKYLKILDSLTVDQLLKEYQCMCSNCHSIKSYEEKLKPITTEKCLIKIANED